MDNRGTTAAERPIAERSPSAQQKGKEESKRRGREEEKGEREKEETNTKEEENREGGRGEQKGVILFHFGFSFFRIFSVIFWEKKNKRGRIEQRKNGKGKRSYKGRGRKKRNFRRHYTDRCSLTFRNIEQIHVVAKRYPDEVIKCFLSFHGFVSSASSCMF